MTEGCSTVTFHANQIYVIIQQDNICHLCGIYMHAYNAWGCTTCVCTYILP